MKQTVTARYIIIKNKIRNQKMTDSDNVYSFKTKYLNFNFWSKIKKCPTYFTLLKKFQKLN